MYVKTQTSIGFRKSYCLASGRVVQNTGRFMNCFGICICTSLGWLEIINVELQFVISHQVIINMDSLFNKEEIRWMVLVSNFILSLIVMGSRKESTEIT